MELQTGGMERLESGATEKWKGRKLSARGSEEQLAGETTFAGTASDGPKVGSIVLGKYRMG